MKIYKRKNIFIFSALILFLGILILGFYLYKLETKKQVATSEDEKGEVMSSSSGDTWETGTTGGTARYLHSSVLYNNKIYSWAGYSTSVRINTLDIYDIASDSWSTGTAGGTARSSHASVIYNGKIYSWAGWSTTWINTLDIYDIASDSWSTGTAGGTARNYHSGVLYDGKIYFWGGMTTGPVYLNTLDIYDIASDSWSTGTAGGTARYQHCAVVYNGKIYIWGGMNSSQTKLNTLDIYDIASDSWSTGTAGGTARAAHSSVLYNGQIYFWGGMNSSNTRINTLDIYDIASDSWSTGTAGGTARQSHSSVVYNGKIYFWAGAIASGRINTLDIYNIASLVYPSLDSPSDGTTGQSTLPELKTTATDLGINYLQYKIELCTDASMTTDCQTFNQTSSQTGWSGQNTQSNTAYTSGTQAVYTIQSALSPGTAYYWKSYYIDPIGANSWSEGQTTAYSFTTQSSSSSDSSSTSNTPETIQIPQASQPESQVTSVVLTPVKDSNTAGQNVVVIIPPKTIGFDAYLSSLNIKAVNLPFVTSTLLSQVKSNAFVVGSGDASVIGMKDKEITYWQVANIQNIWYKAYPPAGSTSAIIIPSLQNNSSIIALSYKDTDLIYAGQPNKQFNPKNLKIAHSIDGITWTVLPLSVVDTVNRTVAVIDKVGGYYTLVAR